MCGVNANDAVIMNVTIDSGDNSYRSDSDRSRKSLDFVVHPVVIVVVVTNVDNVIQFYSPVADRLPVTRWDKDHRLEAVHREQFALNFGSFVDRHYP